MEFRAYKFFSFKSIARYGANHASWLLLGQSHNLVYALK